MSQHWVDDAKYSLPSTYPTDLDYQPSRVISLRLRNICQLLASREISPRTKNSSKRFWHQSSTLRTAQLGRRKEIIDARHALISWVESNSLRNLLAKYCPLLPPPRSTIAAAFSLDGKRLASTHGDHTVKIIDCQTGRCLKVLSGHRRTPWVVRFHPLQSEILASGSLDHEVRLWDAHTAVCIGSYDFYRPIASIAFHAQGEILAVASGHKLFMWHYNNNKRGDSSPPLSVLKTERSLRAVHFHPYALPLLLTAEVSDLDSPDYPLTLATTSGYPQCAPAVFVSNANSNTHTDVEDTIPLMSSPYLYWQTFFRDSGRPLQQYSMATGLASWQRTELSQQTNSNMGRQHNVLVTPMEVFPSEASISNLVTETAVENSLLVGMELGTENMENEVDNRASSVYQGTSLATRVPSMLSGQNVDISTAGNSSNNDDGRYNQLIPFSGLPFLHGWIMGQQTHAGLHTMLPVSAMQRSIDHGSGANFMSSDLQHNGQAALVITSGHLRGDVQNSSRHHSRSRIMVSADSGEAPAELPCTVKLRIWSHDIQVPCATLVPERCLLTIPHAVLCSEMGAHFSPCGRFLAACVACILPQFEGDHGLQSQIIADASGVVTSPTRHPISAHQVIYELHIYSLEKATFGSVLASTAIRAAHCLTSIQFSPTSEHILLAYGRRHGSLRRNLVIDALHTYTIMEVYRVSDMELVSVLPSADDEVNVACFHPLAGGGLVYGTKEGKLRIFQYDGPRGADCMGPNSLFEDNSLEGLQFALEG